MHSLIFSIFFPTALNLRRRPWYAHLPSCPPPLPPRWTLKCPIRVNQGAPAANHSPHPVIPSPWVPKVLRMWQGAWGWRTARAWPLAQALRLKSKGREAPQWSHSISRLVKRLVETLPCCECMNITQPHMLATCCPFFTVPPQTAAERLFNTILLVLIWVAFFCFLGTNFWRTGQDLWYFFFFFAFTQGHCLLTLRGE